MHPPRHSYQNICPNTKKAEDTHRVSSVFFRTSCGKGLERINPTVLWTVGRHRLDGGETIIFAKGENANESLTVYHEKAVVLIETTAFSAKSTLTGGINHLR